MQLPKSLLLILGIFSLISFKPVLAQTPYLNPSVVVIKREDGFQGLAWIVQKNLVITARHNLRDSSNNDKLRPNISFAFYPRYKSRATWRIIREDKERDLILIKIQTKNLPSFKLAKKVRMGEYSYWNLPRHFSFMGDQFLRFERVAGKVLQKMESFSATSVLTGKPLNYFETSIVSPGEELFVILGHRTQFGSSGGPVTNDAGKIIGIVVMRIDSYPPYDNTSGIISVDGIRRFLYGNNYNYYSKSMGP